ncbi:hypothetical protein M758_4G025000 [Ceratodon purpureus]|nr:hypothetical protein M758_4G025000 [Ceratodon purpureus]
MSDGFENLILEDLDEASGNHFTVRILSRTTPTRLEVPAPFSAATGWPGAVQCAVVTSLRNPLEWPLRMTQLSSSSCVGTAISDSYGWSKFTEHMAVSVGDVLDFELLDERCLLASIAYSRGRVPEVVPQEAQVTGGHSPRVAPEEPQVVNDSTPHFKKKLRPSHTRAHKSARLDIPTSFWRSMGQETFDGSLMTLSGPIREHVVRSSVCKTPKQTFCFFSSGWADFVSMNSLQVGDTIVFTKVTNCRYVVKKE